MLRIKTLLLLMLVLALTLTPALAQDEISLDFETFDDFVAAVEAAAADPAELDALWDALVDAEAVPFALGEDVLFMYRGAAEEVAWNGDFNGWGAEPLVGERVGESDLWVASAQFPSNARLDYKVVVDGEWILDPANDRQQWGGFGPNSELAMPDYAYEPLVERQSGIERGTLSDNVTLYSESLGATVNYRLYKPAGYDHTLSYPVIYLTDGQEYIPRQYGAVTTVLDNMIAAGSIEPVMAVFIDPRTPENPDTNRREELYIDNDSFNAFVAEELVPLIDRLYATADSADARAILGTSLGGYHATVMGLEYPEVFGLVGIQSPAYWISDGAESLLMEADDPALADLRVFIASGDPMWDADITPAVDILTESEIEFVSMIVPEGHSWGQWRAQIDDILLFFFGAEM